MEVLLFAILCLVAVVAVYRHHSLQQVLDLLEEYSDWYKYDLSSSHGHNLACAEHAMWLLQQCQARTPDTVTYEDVRDMEACGFTYDIDIPLGANIARLNAIIAALKS